MRRLRRWGETTQVLGETAPTPYTITALLENRETYREREEERKIGFYKCNI